MMATRLDLPWAVGSAAVCHSESEEASRSTQTGKTSVVKVGASIMHLNKMTKAPRCSSLQICSQRTAGS